MAATGPNRLLTRDTLAHAFQETSLGSLPLPLSVQMKATQDRQANRIRILEGDIAALER